MLEQVLQADTQLLIYLNNLGSTRYDAFWLFLTNQLNWWPLFGFLFYLLFKEYHWKHVLVLVFFCGLIGLVTDQTTNLFKNGFERLRPNNDDNLLGFVRCLKDPQSFSFISGHASNTMAFTVFFILLFKKRIRGMYFLLIWPLVFGYSRIYLGLHFPLDIICGYLWGALSGVFHYKLYNRFNTRVLQHTSYGQTISNR